MARLEYALLVLFVSVCVYVSTTRAGLSKDLPEPPANMKNIPAGSLVIPMDTRQYVGNFFNIKTYGLAVHLLYNEVPLYWAIRAGKLKDAKDFTAITSQILPSVGTASNNDFAGGPFIILKAYQTKALDLIKKWQGGNHGIIVHKIEADVSVDIRHEIFVKPKILISNLSGYSNTQTNILTAAGLVKDTHYIVTNAAGAIQALDETSCYTFFSEPHYLWQGDAPAYYSALTKFVQSGGNFLAECAGAYSYENYNPGSGRGGFQSLAGLYYSKTDNQQLKYPNPDTPYNQFMGALDGSNTGHTPDYCFQPPSNIGSTQVDAATEKTWITNNGYFVVVNDPAATKCTNGQTKIIASVSKPGQGDNIGGLVFFLGAHDWSPTGTNGNRDAGKRLYLNALITPAKRFDSCKFNFCPPGQECPHDACHTCLCDDGGSPVVEEIAGCCLTESDCGPCSSCINNRCTDDCGGSCAECQGDQCVSVLCSCSADEDCLPCYGCEDDGKCHLLSENCCTSDEDCGACAFCDYLHPNAPARSDKPYFQCKPKPHCCEVDGDCGECSTCTNNVCIPDCTPCQTCDSDTCNNVDGCCLIDDQCDSCQVCDTGSLTCVACPACTECSADKCVPIADCCVLDDECGTCAACNDENACESTITGDVGSCCVTDDDCTAEGSVCYSGQICAAACSEDNDCEDCEGCIDNVCQPTAECEGGDGDGGSDAARFSPLNHLL